jgi:hypothetical protein
MEFENCESAMAGDWDIALPRPCDQERRQITREAILEAILDSHILEEWWTSGASPDFRM